MKNVYLVAYDVADAKRLRHTYRKLCGFGDPLQYSVFRCELTALQKQALQEQLWPILNLHDDRVILINLGPVGGRGDDCIEYWGDPRVPVRERAAGIV